MYPQVNVRLYRTNNTPIVSNGFFGDVVFDHLSPDLSPLQPGTAEDAGFTPVSNVNVFKQ